MSDIILLREKDPLTAREVLRDPPAPLLNYEIDENFQCLNKNKLDKNGSIPTEYLKLGNDTANVSISYDIDTNTITLGDEGTTIAIPGIIDTLVTTQLINETLIYNDLSIYQKSLTLAQHDTYGESVIENDFGQLNPESLTGAGLKIGESNQNGLGYVNLLYNHDFKSWRATSNAYAGDTGISFEASDFKILNNDPLNVPTKSLNNLYNEVYLERLRIDDLQSSIIGGYNTILIEDVEVYNNAQIGHYYIIDPKTQDYTIFKLPYIDYSSGESEFLPAAIVYVKLINNDNGQKIYIKPAADPRWNSDRDNTIEEFLQIDDQIVIDVTNVLIKFMWDQKKTTWRII